MYIGVTKAIVGSTCLRVTWFARVSSWASALRVSTARYEPLKPREALDVKKGHKSVEVLLHVVVHQLHDVHRPAVLPPPHT